MILKMLEEVSANANCKILPRSGKPALGTLIKIPDDLVEFYELCGGVELYLDRNFGFRIVGSSELVPTSKALLSTNFYERHRVELEDDRTASWYLVARGSGPEEAVSIDLGGEHPGYCYDSFWDTFGTPNCRIVARSFTELLRRLIDAKGEVIYWTEPGAPFYGFAR